MSMSLATQPIDRTRINLLRRTQTITDWSALVLWLRGKRMSLRAIAECCECSLDTIWRLETGVQKIPRHDIGETLKALRDSFHGDP